MLFKGLNMSLREQERVCLIGRNGAGKSTLLRLLAGHLEADRGRRVIRPRVSLVYLEQDPVVTGFTTLAHFCKSPLPDGVCAPQHRIAALATDLAVDLQTPCTHASGGELRRAALVRAFAHDPDILLLDEPTNHMDLAGIDWLEERLERYRGAFIMISHDRMLNSRITRTTLWLSAGKLRRAEIGFGGVEAWMEKVWADEDKLAARLNSKLKQELNWLVHGVTARRRRNRGRLRKLADLREERRTALKLEATRHKAKIAINETVHKSQMIMTLDHVGKRFGERVILKDFSFRVHRGDRIGIIGSNGSGKTTLLKLMSGEIAADSGHISRSPALNYVSISQKRDILEPGKTVRDIIADGGDWVEVNGKRKHAAGYLKEFLFDPKLIDTAIDALSGGERSRLLLAREFARPSNMLILDEPTNDLDLETLDLLQEIIMDYAGVVLLVSHDRDFLNRTVTAVIGLTGNGDVRSLTGGYSAWEADLERHPVRAAGSSKSGMFSDSSREVAIRSIAKPERKKLSYKDQRDYDLIPDRLEGLTARSSDLEVQLADPGLYQRDVDAYSKLSEELEKLKQEMARLEDRWLELEALQESFARRL